MGLVQLQLVTVSVLTCFWCGEGYPVARRRGTVVVTGNHNTRVVGPRSQDSTHIGCHGYQYEVRLRKSQSVGKWYISTHTLHHYKYVQGHPPSHIITQAHFTRTHTHTLTHTHTHTHLGMTSQVSRYWSTVTLMSLGGNQWKVWLVGVVLVYRNETGADGTT